MIFCNFFLHPRLENWEKPTHAIPRKKKKTLTTTEWRGESRNREAVLHVDDAKLPTGLNSFLYSLIRWSFSMKVGISHRKWGTIGSDPRNCHKKKKNKTRIIQSFSFGLITSSTTERIKTKKEKDNEGPASCFLQFTTEHFLRCIIKERNT